MALNNISYTEVRRAVQRMQSQNNNQIIKDVRNFPLLNPDDSYADTTRKTSSSPSGNTPATRIKELLKILTSAPDIDQLLSQIFNTINIHRRIDKEALIHTLATRSPEDGYSKIA